jgi:hypothetical protein
MNDDHEPSQLTGHDGPLPQAGSWPLSTPRTVAEALAALIACNRRTFAQLTDAALSPRKGFNPERSIGRMPPEEVMP